jgi:hypothetical protein
MLLARPMPAAKQSENAQPCSHPHHTLPASAYAFHILARTLSCTPAWDLGQLHPIWAHAPPPPRTALGNSSSRQRRAAAKRATGTAHDHATCQAPGASRPTRGTRPSPSTPACGTRTRRWCGPPRLTPHPAAQGMTHNRTCAPRSCRDSPMMAKAAGCVEPMLHGAPAATICFVPSLDGVALDVEMVQPHRAAGHNIHRERKRGGVLPPLRGRAVLLPCCTHAPSHPVT